MMNRNPVATTDEELLDRVRHAIVEIEPGARVILYGSRARGDAAPDSDWDLLIILDDAIDDQRRRAVSDRLLDLLIETGASLSPFIMCAEDWDSPRSRATPFYANVTDDGIELTAGGTRVRSRSNGAITQADEATMAEAREDIIREWLQRARSTLMEAELLARGGAWNGCVSRLYYACFDAVTALLLRHGYRFSKHAGVQSLFNLHFVKTGIVPPELGELFNKLFDQRLAADYQPFARFDEEQVREWKARAESLVNLIDGLLALPPSSNGEA